MNSFMPNSSRFTFIIQMIYKLIQMKSFIYLFVECEYLLHLFIYLFIKRFGINTTLKTCHSLH
jgi:hypothetical protein